MGPIEMGIAALLSVAMISQPALVNYEIAVECIGKTKEICETTCFPSPEEIAECADRGGILCYSGFRPDCDQRGDLGDDAEKWTGVQIYTCQTPTDNPYNPCAPGPVLTEPERP